uniref:Uncharacterized protein n=1 Tax=Anguilla anguilla TaxID=7936 RepID=A0A0E9VFF3_ANGAN
MLLLSVSG